MDASSRSRGMNELITAGGSVPYLSSPSFFLGGCDNLNVFVGVVESLSVNSILDDVLNIERAYPGRWSNLPFPVNFDTIVKKKRQCGTKSHGKRIQIMSRNGISE